MRFCLLIECLRVCVCVFWCLVSELQVIKNRGWRGVQEERKKQEIKDEGHFIGLMTLGDTVKKKSRIQRGRDGEAKKKGLKHSSV